MTIVQRAAAMLQGTISASNDEKALCVFRVDVPRVLGAANGAKPVAGVDAVQPTGRSKK